MWARKPIVSCKHRLIGGAGWSSEDQNAGRHAEREDQICDISAGNEESLGKLTKDHACVIIGKSFST